jgi:Prokaryotic N-terminal methylation motif
MTRQRHHTSRGFTLVEALIATSILVLVVVAVAAAFGAGVRTVGAGGAGDLLAGDHDLITLEQSLGRDMARAECVYSPPSTRVVGYCHATPATMGTGAAQSTCTSPPAALSLPAGATPFFCAAWSEFWEGSSGTCHVAVYYRYASPSAPQQKQIFRTEAKVVIVGAAPSTTALVLAQHLTTQDVTVSPALGSQGDVQITLTGAPGARSPITLVDDYRSLGTIPTYQTGTDLC